MIPSDGSPGPFRSHPGVIVIIMCYLTDSLRSVSYGSSKQVMYSTKSLYRIGSGGETLLALLVALPLRPRVGFCAPNHEERQADGKVTIDNYYYY